MICCETMLRIACPPVQWNAVVDEAFEACKAALTAAMLLSHPQPDAVLGLVTDASDHSIWAALQ